MRARHHVGKGRFAGLLLLGFAAAAGCSSGQRDRPAEEVPAGWPVARADCRVTSAFGSRRSGGRHEGIDLSAAKKTRVVATAAGRVIFAGRSGAYGRMVVIDHGSGFETRYAHLASTTVRKGERVRRGELIGRVGKSGNATGYHLHYEVRRDGRTIDPWPFMD